MGSMLGPGVVDAALFIGGSFTLGALVGVCAVGIGLLMFLEAEDFLGKAGW